MLSGRKAAAKLAAAKHGAAEAVVVAAVAARCIVGCPGIDNC